MESVTIPFSVTSIGDYAFQGCYSLKIVYNLSSLNIVKGSDTHGYVAYYADKVLPFVDGVYYMKNVGAGLFLTGGNARGTQGTFSENGFDVTVTALPSGKYVIDTKVDNSGNHYLGADGFIDAPQAEWTFKRQTDGTYAITNDGVNYIGYDSWKPWITVLNLHLTNPSEDDARWQFMTYEEVMAEICTATKDNPKTVTMLLPGAAFNQGDTRNGLWSDEPAVGGYQTEFGNNQCGEKWNTPSFDVAQTLTNLPNGYYKVSMQGFYRMGGDASKNDATIAEKNHAAGTETLNAIFYANNEEKPLMSIIEGAQAEEFAYGASGPTIYGNVPQDMAAAAAAFTDGKYEHSLWVEVTDGTLRVGVKKDAESVNDWTIFDNFRIVYYGNPAISIDRASMKLLKGESMTLSAEVTSEDATNKIVTWSSSNASVATVDQNGNVTAVGVGTATITATAGDYSATCEVTVVTLTDGVYYMKNVGAGLFLTGGNAWGTQGTFSENGFDVIVTMLPSGKYVIDTKVYNWGNHYLGADGFIDAPQAEWTIEPQPGGTYAITNDGVNYIGYDGSTTVLNLHLTNPSEDNARWQFMTYEEVMAEISTATKDNPKTVTMLLPGAAFNQGDTRNGLWSDAPGVGGYQTLEVSNKCGGKYSFPSFDMAQTLTKLPNGYYKVSMQGFYQMGGDENVFDASLAEAHHKDGTETLNAIFYANNEEKPLMSIFEGAQTEMFAYGQAFNTSYGYVPNDIDAAAAAFTDGKYEHSLLVEVTDGTLRVGVKKDAESVNDWTVIDNFRIVYYGNPASGISIDRASMKLLKGESMTLSAEVTPEDATDAVTWSSSNASVATVDQNGNVTAVGVGTATITATAGDYSATCEVTVTIPFIPVSGITLSQNAASLFVDEGMTLSAEVTPEDATDKTVTWSSSNASVATVDQNGNVTAVGAGTATITATAGDCSATCEVTVTIPFIPVSGITLSQNAASLFVDEGMTLSAEVTPEDATDKTVTWSSSNASVATVDQNGNVTAVGVGTATITATAGDYSATCEVTVTIPFIPVSGITLSQNGASLFVYEGMTLSAEVTPEDATNKTVTWSSSNASVATVDQNGNVTAVGAGTATITATAGDCSATCEVTVTIPFIPVSGITLSQNGASLFVYEGMTLSAEVTPEDATNKTVTWSSSNASVATVDQNGNVTAVGVGTATITATAGDCSATCEVTVTIPFIPVSGITLSQNAASLFVDEGMTLSAEVTPEDATDKTVTWSSSNASVATVDQNGNVTAVGAGTATITATAGDCSATCEVTVTIPFIPVSGITLSQNAASLFVDEGMTLSAEVTPEDATDKTVTWSSSNASVATVDQNGNVTAVGVGTATITATAGDYSATCEVTVTKQVSLVTLTDGVYYMKNVGAGLFLTGGNAWGTQGTFSENGFDVTVTTLPSGKYVIDTKVDNWGNHYLGADGFIDAPQAEWTIEPRPGGTYAITNDGVNYIGYDGSTTVLNLHLTNPSEDNARWQFMTYEEVMAEICTATKDNPKTVTMLLPGASFNQNDTRNGLWSDEPAVGGYHTWEISNKCGEKFSIPSFDVAQTLTNLPNGYYKVSMQGFYRMGSGDLSQNDATIAAERHAAGTETLNAIFYANNEEKPLMSIIEGAQAEEFAYGGAFYTAYGNVPQDMDAAAAAFTDGKYEHSLWVEVTDGTLRVGVKKNAESVSDWTIFDNFRVVYYGTQQPDAIEEATAVVTFQTNDVYDLSGRLVRRQAESLDGLKPGVYIINGKKYMVK